MRTLLSGIVVSGLLISGLSVVTPALTSSAVAAEVGDAPEASVPGPGVAEYVPGPDPDMAINLADEPNPVAPVAPATGSSTETVLTPTAADDAAEAPPSTDAFVLEEVDELAAKAKTNTTATPTSTATAVPSPTAAPPAADPVPLDPGDAVTLDSLGATAAQNLGADFVAFQLTAGPGDDQGLVKARVDYSGFARAYGAEYASRLKVVAYPGCSLTTPDVPGCLNATDVVTANDPVAQEVSAVLSVGGSGAVSASEESSAKNDAKTSARSGASAEVSTAAVSASAQVFALSAGASGQAGTYTATDLSAAGSWAVGEASGSFSYSYPVPMPPSVGGQAPKIALQYDSGSVDGVTLASNGQASWVGRGWDLNPGFIERKYKPCSKDGHPTWGDLCWDSPYSDKDQGSMFISLNGKATEMIWQGSNHWRAADDSGWRITHMTGASPGNGDDNGEFWLVQSTDGMQYYFGHGSQVNKTRDTHSVGVVPVFGGSGEPQCADTTENWCRQAYRWQLDYVVDRNENTTTYFYEQEQNRYAIHGDTDRSAYYTSAMTLARIEYGQQWGEETSTPPVKVEFNARVRCKESAVEDDPLNHSPATCPSYSSSPASYPDVPLDLMCAETCTSKQNSPTFFTTKRLNDIQTYVRDVDGAAWDAVAQIQTRMGFPDPGDGSDPSLWLDFLQTRGYAGDDLTAPITNFNGEVLFNRFDHGAAGVSAQPQRRISQVINELGGRTDVTYGRPDACPESKRDQKADGDWDHNTDDCFAVKFDPDGDGPQEPGFGIFNKWLVTKVENVDLVGGSPTEVWAYAYAGNPAWAYSNSLLFAQGHGDQTWDQWRGYKWVTVTHGNGDTKTHTVNTYFQGMDGDHNANDSTKNASMDDFLGTTWTDLPSRTGRLLQSQTLNDDGTVLASTRSRYTSVLTEDGPGIHNAVMTQEEGHYTRERINAATDTWREREVETTYNGFGLPTRVLDQGELGVEDNMCTDTFYAFSTDEWGEYNYLILPDNTITYRGDCGTGVRTAHTVTYYDGADSTATDHPFDGKPTSTFTYTADDPNPAVTSHTEATFDSYGRPTSTTAPNQVNATSPKRTRYAYAPATGVPVDGITTTNPAGHVSVTYPSRVRASPNKVKDPNGVITTLNYDAFNRLTTVERPGDLLDGQLASNRYVYPGTVSGPVMRTRPGWVLSQTRQNRFAQYLSSYEYVDGFGRTRESQIPSPYKADTRMVSITRYDSRGLVSGVSPPQYNANPASSGLLDPATADLTSYVHTDYDSRERPIATVQEAAGIEQWRSTTSYLGDRVVVNPPVGGNTVTYSDVFGRTTKIAEYTSATAHQDTTYSYSYPTTGPRTSITDPAGEVTSFSNDLAGQRIAISDPNAGASSLEYDKNGNQISATDPSGTVATTYDALDRPLVRTATPAGGTAATAATWTYDPSGAKGQLASTTATTATGVSGVGNLTTTHTVTGYDDRYRPTGMSTTLGTNTALGALSGQSYTETYGYDSADHQTTVTYPAVGGLPGEKATTAYSDYGTPTTLGLTATTGGASTAIITGTDFTGSGLYDGRTWASGAQRNVDWDMTVRAPKTVQAYYTPTSGTPVYWQDDDYTRDAVGNITSLSDRMQAPDQTQCFTYDTRNRLTQAWTTNPATTPCTTIPADTATTWNTGIAPYRTKWSHTSTGNLASVSNAAITGTTSTFTTHTYGYQENPRPFGSVNPPAAATSVTPQLAGTTGKDTYFYDTAGRMKTKTVAGVATTLAWNPEQQLISSTSGTAVHKYGYDTDGQRSIKITPTAVTAYFGATELTTPTTGAGTITGKRSYTHSGSTVALRTGNSAITYLFSDIQGSATVSATSGTPATATVTRQRYTPYGATRGNTNQLPTDHGWLGQTEDDTTGLTYLNARYYDPLLSRFLTPDPLLTAGAPITHNPYTYALGNPLTFTDPSGLNPCTPDDGVQCGRDSNGGANDSGNGGGNTVVGGGGGSSSGGGGSNSGGGGSSQESGNENNPGTSGSTVPSVPEISPIQLQPTPFITTFIWLNSPKCGVWGAYVCGGGPDPSVSLNIELVAQNWSTGAPSGAGAPSVGGAAGSNGGAGGGIVFPPIKAGASGGPTAFQKFGDPVRAEALRENSNVCVYCRMVTNRPQVDHAIPRARGGNATIENAQTTCGFCNASKGARDFPVNPPPGYVGAWPPSWWRLMPTSSQGP